MMHRFLTLGPDNESLWVPLYVHPYATRWAVMIVADGALLQGWLNVRG